MFRAVVLRSRKVMGDFGVKARRDNEPRLVER
jgi:hypothetical protein